MKSNLGAQTVVVDGPATTVMTAELRSQVDDFLGKELAVHLAAIEKLNPPPTLILGVPTTGEFSWGTFMRSLSAYAESSGKHELAGRDLAKWVGQIGLVEAHVKDDKTRIH